MNGVQYNAPEGSSLEGLMAVHTLRVICVGLAVLQSSIAYSITFHTLTVFTREQSVQFE